MIKLFLMLILSVNFVFASEFKLEIKKEDGKTYWKESFKTMEELNKWLNEEKTRKYWNKKYTPVITEDVKPIIFVSPEKTAAKKLLRDKLNTEKGLTLKEINEYLRD